MVESLAHVAAALDRDSPSATFYTPQFAAALRLNQEAPLGERGLQGVQISTKL